MMRYRTLLRAAPTFTGLAAAALIAGCADNGPTAVVPGLKPVDSLFTSYVALGNSLTAGFQSGGIVDSTQRQSYAALLAGAMNTRYAYAALAAPGCPPPITNFQTQARLGGASSTATTCALRDPTSIAAALNNVGVPDATSLDPTSPTTSVSNALTTLILGGKTQVQKAADANPTFFSAWVGNNDALIPGISGLLVASAGVSPGLNSLATFQKNYDAMVAGLKAIPTVRGGVLIGVVQVAATPILFPAAALFNPAFKAGFDQFAGTTTTILPSCTPTTTALISFRIAAAIRAGQHPAFIGCAKNSVPGTPVGDIFVLDATEQATLSATVASYNTYLQSVATANGWAYFDPNPLLLAQKASGCVATVPNIGSATQPFGACVSLDGVHPSLLGHQKILAGLEAAINAKYATHLGSPVGIAL